MNTSMGERIKQLRKSKDISQETLAQMLGVTYQAISKWETGATMPDVGLIPAIAAFFDVTTDTLFGYNLLENEQTARAICAEAASVRGSDAQKAEKILRDGLARFPGNTDMLTMLLYVYLSMDGREDDIIELCNLLVERTTNEGVRCDVLRILAETYATLGHDDLARLTLDKIPEFYFTKMECVAKLLHGSKAMEAAQYQMNFSAKTTVEMLRILAHGYEAQGQQEEAAICRALATGMVSLWKKEKGTQLEMRGYEWVNR